MSELQNVRTEYKQDSTRRAHLVDIIVFEWKLNCRMYGTLKCLGGFVCRPATRETAGRKLTMQFEPVLEREREKGGRLSEKERKPLMTQADGLL